MGMKFKSPTVQEHVSSRIWPAVNVPPTPVSNDRRELKKHRPLPAGRAAFSPRRARNFQATIIVQYFPSAPRAVFAALLNIVDRVSSGARKNYAFARVYHFSF